MNNFEYLKYLYSNNRKDELIDIINSNSVEDNNELLSDAIYENNFELFNLLLPVSNIFEKNNGCLVMASEMGRVEMVKVLLPISIKVDTEYKAFEVACYNSKLEIIDIILPKVKNIDKINTELFLSVIHGNILIFSRLFPFFDKETEYGKKTMIHVISKNNEKLLNKLLPLYNREELIEIINSIDVSVLGVHKEIAKKGISNLEDYINKLQKDNIIINLKDELNNSNKSRKRKI